MTPLVSILIPAFNAEDWIRDTIRSALAQTWPRKEIIVVDDGSVDDTAMIAQQFASSSVVVIRQSNQGAAAARNAALAASQGDYIQWLDADDLLSNQKIELQMDALGGEGPGTVASSGWGYFRYRPSKARFVSTDLWADLDPLEWILRKWETNQHMQTATWLISRELTSAAGPWDTRLLADDDGEYFMRVVGKSDRVKFVRGARVYYRVSPSTRLSVIGRSDRKMEAHVLGMQLQIEYLRSIDDSERVREACKTYLETWLHVFYSERPDIVERMEQLAAALGKTLRAPELSWKYAWIQVLFGWRAAKVVRFRYNQAKAFLLRAWDKALFRLGEREINVRGL